MKPVQKNIVEPQKALWNQYGAIVEPKMPRKTSAEPQKAHRLTEPSQDLKKSLT